MNKDLDTEYLNMSEKEIDGFVDGFFENYIDKCIKRMEKWLYSEERKTMEEERELEFKKYKETAIEKYKTWRKERDKITDNISQ